MKTKHIFKILYSMADF